MNNIALISCVSKKLQGAHKAKDIYISPLFKKSKIYAEKHYDDYYILSARYGLLHKNKIINSYNLTLNNMNNKKKQIWSVLVAKQIKQYIKTNNKLIILAGSNYYKNLVKYIPHNYQIIMKGMSIGQRLQYLGNNL
tara:strand:+ start:5412 stop:5819 length:408 start_codon:yes stop_codon:yes gene_type:complete